MKKEDKYGFAGVLLCAVVGTYDKDWRVFWFAAGALLAAWTVWCLIKPGDPEN